MTTGPAPMPTPVAPLVTMDLTVVRVKAITTVPTILSEGPDAPVSCLAVDEAGTELELIRTVATQLPIGARLTMTLSASSPHGVCTLHEAAS